jgi:EmrB/QacA subfamily drug resistance transporter
MDKRTERRAPGKLLGLPLVLACGGSFLGFLDVTITILAIPNLATHLAGTSLRSLSWVITLYAVMFAALLAPAGRLADVIGRRRLYLVGVAVFGTGSLLSALAPNLGALLAARAIQGVGAALLMPASLAIVLSDIAPDRRTAAIGLWSASASVAAAIGPSLGGLLVDTFGWRALFLINVPAVVALLYFARRLPARATLRGLLPDIPGTALLIAGVGLLVVAVTEVRVWRWTSPATLVCVGAGVVALASAIGRSRRHPVPALEIGLWRNPTYAAANLVSVAFGAVLYAWLLLGVLFLTSVWHYSELRAGLAMTPGAIAAAAVGIGIGRVRRKPSARVLTTGGALLLGAIGLVLSLVLPTHPHYLALWLPTGIVIGAAIASVSVGVSSAAALSVQPESFAGAVGLNVAARQFGGALGVAAMTALVAGSPSTTTSFARVYLLGAIVMVVAAALGLRLGRNPVSAPMSSPPLTAVPQLTTTEGETPS